MFDFLINWRARRAYARKELWSAAVADIQADLCVSRANEKAKAIGDLMNDAATIDAHIAEEMDKPEYTALEGKEKYEADQIVKPEDITYYDALPQNSVAAMKGHGIDLAISQKENADYTTEVEGDVFYVDDAPAIFITPNPFNEHVTFHQFLLFVRAIPGERNPDVLLGVES